MTPHGKNILTFP
uniref:Uncharacterized protein n=1 Tax=Rhizophora mucronata TaxID=61149 RepID=A0A2P2PGS3_RHIMU